MKNLVKITVGDKTFVTDFGFQIEGDILTIISTSGIVANVDVSNSNYDYQLISSDEI